jgi:hypothetical protein
VVTGASQELHVKGRRQAVVTYEVKDLQDLPGA